jgi:hypothetical protein
MEHFRNITAQQLVMAASGALVVAGVMLSRANRLGFLPLAIAILCGLGAFAKSKRR